MGLLNGLHSIILKLAGSSLELARVKYRFKFLEEQGFRRHQIKTSIVFILEYTRGPLLISPCYDYREQLFSLALGDLSNQESMYIRTDILATEIGSHQARNILKQGVDGILAGSKISRQGLLIKDFDDIVSLYANFVKENLEDILAQESIA